MKYSVITVNYNDCEGLLRTIKSVVSQTYTDFEFIVIDGGSTDGGVDVLREFTGQIDYWVSEKDRGIFQAMNKGVAQAKGDYCIFMNSGDCFFSDSILEEVAANGWTEDLIVGRDTGGSEDHVFPQPTREVSLYYLCYNGIPHQASFIKTELLREFPYDEDLRIVSDFKFYLQAMILKNCSVRFVDDVIAVFDAGGISSTHTEALVAEQQKVLSELFPPRVLADCRYMNSTECLTQQLTPRLKKNYGIDRILYNMGNVLLKIIGK